MCFEIHIKRIYKSMSGLQFIIPTNNLLMQIIEVEHYFITTMTAFHKLLTIIGFPELSDDIFFNICFCTIRSTL